MTKQDIVGELIDRSKKFLDMWLLDPLSGNPSNACYGVKFGMVDMSLLKDACLDFRKNLPEGIDLYVTDKTATFEVMNGQGRTDSIVYLLNTNRDYK